VFRDEKVLTVGTIGSEGLATLSADGAPAMLYVDWDPMVPFISDVVLDAGSQIVAIPGGARVGGKAILTNGTTPTQPLELWLDPDLRFVANQIPSDVWAALDYGVAGPARRHTTTNHGRFCFWGLPDDFAGNLLVSLRNHCLVMNSRRPEMSGKPRSDWDRLIAQSA